MSLRKLVIAIITWLAVSPMTVAAPDDSSRPNFVVLLIDDAAMMDLGAYGGEARTPNIDALARRGAMFTNYQTSPLCSPSRAMLLTGIDNHRTGVATIEEVLPPELRNKPGYSLRLEPGVLTVATRLKSAGYRTYMTGKWHLGHGDGDLPSAHGFDRSFALDASGADNWEQKPYMPYYQDAPWFEDGKPATLPEDFYSSKFLVDRMITYLRGGSDSGKPFLAYIAFQAVHIPVQAPRSFTDHYRGRFDAGWEVLQRARWERAKALGLIAPDAPLAQMPANARKWESLTAEERRISARSMEVYAGMLEAMDHHVGRLVGHLKKSGQYDNTVFIITSDNGPEPSDPVHAPGMNLWMATHGYAWQLEGLGEKGSLAYVGPEWAAALASPGRLFKFYTASGGLRVPMIMSGPGITGGLQTMALSHVTDITPTILDLAGVSPVPGAGEVPMTGTSLRGVLDETTAGSRPATEPLGVEVSGNAALFRGSYKIVRYAPPHGDMQWHLYNTATDPGETMDLGPSMPDLLAAMIRDYEAYEKKMGVLALPEGYDVQQQIMWNSLSRQFEAYWWILALGLLMVAGGTTWLWRRLRRV